MALHLSQTLKLSANHKSFKYGGQPGAEQFVPALGHDADIVRPEFQPSTSYIIYPSRVCNLYV